MDPSQAHTPNVESVSPVKRLILAGGVFLGALVYYQKEGCWVHKILDLFIHAPLFKRDDDRWYFPGFCGVSETTMCNSHQGSSTTFPHVSLFTKDDDSCKRVPVRCCFWRTYFWHFHSIVTSRYDRIYPGIKQFFGSGFGQILFLSAVFFGFHSR